MEEELESEISKYTQMIDGPVSSVEESAQALISRGVIYNNLSNWQLAIADFTQVIENLSDVPLELVNRALFNRAFAYEKNHDHLKAVSDNIKRKGHPDAALKLEIAKYTQVIQHPYSSTEEIAQALISRSIVYLGSYYKNKYIEHSPKWRLAIADLTQLIETLPDVPEKLIVEALFIRSEVYEKHYTDEAIIADYTQIIEDHPSISVDQLIIALTKRGDRYGYSNNNELAIADYSHIIDHLPDASTKQKVEALLSRSFWYWDCKKYDLAIADCSFIIGDLSNVNVEQFAQALIRRGYYFKELEKSELAISDFTQVIDDVFGVSTESLVCSLVNRARIYISQGKSDLALADFKQVHTLPGESDNWDAKSGIDDIYEEFGYPFEW